MAKIVGSFYLRKTDSGNLLGEFTNNARFTVSTENADLKEAGDVPYVGRYLSTWLEGDVPHTAELVIDHLDNAEACGKHYKLVWNDLHKGPIYEAEALLAEDVLVGHYISLS
jgi:hypothetical protein